MLLNTVLTVRAHQANSHHDIGWEQFTDAAIRVLNEQDRPMVFILWGRPAQAKKAMLNNPKHMILERLIQARYLLTEDFSAAVLSARPMIFSGNMVWSRLTGRLKT